MRPVVLYRPGDMEAPELEAATKHFPTFYPRTALKQDDFVVARYCALPFFKHGIQADCDYVGATLINNFHQHCYAADLRNWAEDLKELTPKTWYWLEDVDEDGPYVLKGKTNSRKFDWRTHMFAKDKAAAAEVFWRLSTDGLIGGEQQQIYVRKYIPLKKHAEGLNGLPISHEFRVFAAFGQVICGAFYWSNYVDDLPTKPSFDDVPKEFVEEVLRRIGGKINFAAIDFAQDETGKWWVIEVNDGQMSGLSENDPEVLYSGLRKLIDQKFVVPGK